MFSVMVAKTTSIPSRLVPDITPIKRPDLIRFPSFHDPCMPFTPS
ncbi:hypothetical protein UUU_21370 [Klebsiella pneumoniae subsp. pneumoniae DSM 30104 = JCM 1662 = NBRC 14940]|nr:hypothetical protein UUU_21370 [Klebsiella pneumoniae subsp. pneumoniae DSM 30104 = JCM 1662 = NBRC 14940]